MNEKKYCITLIIIGVIILFSITILSFNNTNMNKALELRVPLLAKKKKQNYKMEIFLMKRKL